MVDFDECIEDGVGGSARNIYNHDYSVDSAIASAASSRRNSNNPFTEFKEFIRRRRYTNGRRFKVSSKFRSTNSGSDTAFRKVSVDSQFFDDSDDETQLKGRRFSVPEKTFCNLDYAILRPSQENRIEIVTAFDKHSDPYKQYMQNISCYDLAPTHGMVVLIDGKLSLHKALLALSQSTGNKAALVVNPTINEILGILTTTDCLRAVMIAIKDDPLVGNLTVLDFLQKYNGRKRLVTAPVHMSVWDAARLFCLNHVHRIPIIQSDECANSTDVLYLLSLRTIFSETILNLVESSGLKTKDFSLAPHIKNRTLEQARVGTWNKIITLSCTSACGEAVDIFLNSKISCVAVVDEYEKLVGSISKSDIMRLFMSREESYGDLLLLPVKEACSAASVAYVHSTIFETITILLKGEQPCVFVVDVMTEKPVAAVAYIDIMDYILNSSEVRQKMSGA